MASVTAEVMLYFGLSMNDPEGREVAESVNALRFDYGIENSRTIIDLITPAYRAGYARAGED